MADSALSTLLLERYGAIEQAYCQERWSSVIADGQILLGDLTGSGEDPPEGLKERLQLLIAHACLYGLGDRDSAEDLYQAVLRSGAEASLRQIAEEGLQQCSLPVAAPESPQEPPEQEREQHPDPAASSAFGTSAWPEVAAELPADSVMPSPSGSTPALQQASAPLQGLQDDWGRAASPASAGEHGALGWLTADATAVPQERAAVPVMPWLDTGAAGTASAAKPFQLEQVSGQEDLASRQDRQKAAFVSAEPEDGQAGSPLEAVSEQAVPSARAAASVERTSPVGEDALLLSAGTTASLQVIAASVVAFEHPSSRPQPDRVLDSVLDSLPPHDRADLPPASLDASQEGPTGGDDLEAFTAAVKVSTTEERLVPDVVDEPELIELHQADSLHREELLVQAVADEVAPLMVEERDVLAQAPAELGLPSEPVGRPGGFQDRRAEPPLEPVPVEVPAPVAAIASPQVEHGGTPFRDPPEPVAEEDPELLMGLLKVEMG